MAESAKLATIPEGFEVGETSFSADGRHVAFVGTRDGKAFVFLDGKMSKPYEDASRLAFSGATGKLAFVAWTGGKGHVVVDDADGPPNDGIGSVLFAPGGQVVYSASREGRWFVVAGRLELAVPGASDPAPFVSADGRWMVFTEQRPGGGKLHLRACSLDLKDCLTGSGYDFIGSPRALTSGAGVAFIATRGEQEAVVTATLDRGGVAERPAGWYDAIALFDISEGGGHLALVARRAKQEFVVRDGEESPLPAGASPMQLLVSRTGRMLLLATEEGRLSVRVDGRQMGPGREGIYWPSFSADGNGYTFAAGGDSSSAVVVDGTEGPTFDKVVTPRFTPDGTRVVYRARQHGERFVVVADRRARTLREHPHYQAVFDVAFSADGKSVGYGVRKGQELWWRVEPL